jgi:hypothetical protein
MENDFIEILKLFPSYPSTNIDIWSKSQDLKAISRRWRLFAPQQLSSKNAEHLIALKRKILELNYILIKNSPNQIENQDATTLNQDYIETQIDSTLSDLLSLVDTSILALKMNQEIKITGLMLSEKMDKIAAFSNVLIAEGVPLYYREMFRRVLEHFIIPLSTTVRRENQVMYLTMNLNQLNFTWNELNQIVFKRTTDLPPTMKQYFNTIANRWNQVMKICYGF